MNIKKSKYRVVEVLGFNGLPYSDYNRQQPNRRDIWFFFTIVGEDFRFSFRSCCHLDQRFSESVVEKGLGDEIIQACINWLLEN